MYEISLVPDVKGELLKKQKLRNLIILICIIVAGACVGLLLILGLISGGQSLTISGLKNEIRCRYDGSGKNCNANMGTPILKFDNAEDILTIQKQMENVGRLNDEKVKLSRIFGVLDVILPNNAEDQVTLTELSVDLMRWSIYFNASAHSNNGIYFRAVDSFKKGLALSYYDYGSYMRKANEGESGDADGYVAIPSFCVDETTVNGYVFGVYHKGMPYCEENVVLDNSKPEEEKSDEQNTDGQTNNAENTTESETSNTGGGQTEYVDKLAEVQDKLGDNQRLYKENDVYYAVEDVWIRRTFKYEKDLQDYKNGKDEKVQDKLAKDTTLAEGQRPTATPKGYYFASRCIVYTGGNDDSQIDETATQAACPVLADELIMGQQGVGRDSDGVLSLSFEANVPLSKEIFLAKNTHMQVKNVTRQNVTDSYVQVRDMFSEALVMEGN